MNNTVFLILYGKILIFNYPLNKTNAPPVFYAEHRRPTLKGCRGGLCWFIAKAIPPLLKKGGPFLKEWVPFKSHKA
jgi:hypothetical protein